jgi:DNA repair protein RadC
MAVTYPESKGKGDLLMATGSIIDLTQPIDCQRVVLQRTHDCPKVKIGRPSDIIELLKEMKNYDRERGIIVMLDTKNFVIGIENISTGTINSSLIHPREVLKGCILANATNTIFAHNHPSGDPNPSNEDVNMDKRLKEAFDIIGITLLDSIIQ